MRTAVLVVSILAALLTGTASADEIWKYRDPVSQRDVFVSKLDQVPPAYRGQAQLMVADGVLVHSEPRAGVSGGTVVFGEKALSSSTEAIKSAVRRAMDKDLSLRSLTAATVMAMDAALVKAGKVPITPAESTSLARLLVFVLVALSAAGLAAFAMWVVLMVHAWREGHPGWAVLILLVNLLGLVYALVHVERRLLRWSAVLSYVAPVLVGVAAAWQLRAWFLAIAAARG